MSAPNETPDAVWWGENAETVVFTAITVVSVPAFAVAILGVLLVMGVLLCPTSAVDVQQIVNEEQAVQQGSMVLGEEAQGTDMPGAQVRASRTSVVHISDSGAAPARSSGACGVCGSCDACGACGSHEPSSSALDNFSIGEVHSPRTMKLVRARHRLHVTAARFDPSAFRLHPTRPPPSRQTTRRCVRSGVRRLGARIAPAAGRRAHRARARGAAVAPPPVPGLLPGQDYPEALLPVAAAHRRRCPAARAARRHCEEQRRDPPAAGVCRVGLRLG